MASLTPLSYETKSLLRIRTYGTGSPLVLLHGWGLNSGVWQSVIERFSQRYQVITIDLPGYGENVACVPEAYTLAAVCEWVADKIPANAILLGWSMGGLIAQQIAIQNSPSLRALITLSSSPCFQQKKDWLGIKPNVLGTFEQQLAQDYVKTLNRFMAIQALGSPEAKSEIVLLKQAISA